MRKCALIVAVVAVLALALGARALGASSKPPEEKSQPKSQFDRIDSNGDGRITREEFESHQKSLQAAAKEPAKAVKAQSPKPEAAKHAAESRKQGADKKAAWENKMKKPDRGALAKRAGTNKAQGKKMAAGKSGGKYAAKAPHGKAFKGRKPGWQGDAQRFRKPYAWAPRWNPDESGQPQAWRQRPRWGARQGAPMPRYQARGQKRGWPQSPMMRQPTWPQRPMMPGRQMMQPGRRPGAGPMGREYPWAGKAFTPGKGQSRPQAQWQRRQQWQKGGKPGPMMKQGKQSAPKTGAKDKARQQWLRRQRQQPQRQGQWWLGQEE